MAVTVGVEPGVELDSPETEQWMNDKFEAWRLSREARWQRVTQEGPTGEATKLELVELEADPVRINEGKGKGERNSPPPHPRLACKGRLAQGTSSFLKLRLEAEASTLSQQTFVGGCHVPRNVPSTNKDHLDKSLLSREQWTWVLRV